MIWVSWSVKVDKRFHMVAMQCCFAGALPDKNNQRTNNPENEVMAVSALVIGGKRTGKDSLVNRFFFNVYNEEEYKSMMCDPCTPMRTIYVDEVAHTLTVCQPYRIA